jgi:hypothetical protein
MHIVIDEKEMIGKMDLDDCGKGYDNNRIHLYLSMYPSICVCACVIHR